MAAILPLAHHNVLILLVVLFITKPILSQPIQPTPPTQSPTTPPQPFDINEAYRQLMFSYSSYCTGSSLQAWDCFFCTYNQSLTDGFKLTTFLYNATKDIFGYIGYRGDTVEVVFRGTVLKSLKNWIDDIDFAPIRPYPSAKDAFVHSGFMSAYETVRLAAKAAVIELITQIKPSRVVITGHSLGGALATLCATELAPLLPVPVHVYNYGSPRVGNINFVNYFESLVEVVYRITYNTDLVPHLPETFLGYQHHPTEVWFRTPNDYTICDSSTGEDPHCSDSIKLLSIYDHLHYLNITLHQDGC